MPDIFGFIPDIHMNKISGLDKNVRYPAQVNGNQTINYSTERVPGMFGVHPVLHRNR